MAQIEKTVFISYRRADVYTALAVYENLKNQGYDVFFDYRSISSGDFEQIITSNIRARAHFILILTPKALDRCSEPEDWVRREIELAIDERRNIVPLFFKGFQFGTSSKSGVSKWLRINKPDVIAGKLKDLSRYNGLNVHEDYFEEAMYRLRTEYLSRPLDTVLHPVSTEVQKVVEEEQIAADEALKQREVSIEPAKPTEEKLIQKKEIPKPIPSKPEKKVVTSPTSVKAIPWGNVGSFASILAFVTILIWGGMNFWNNLSPSTPDSTRTPNLAATQSPRSTNANTPSPSKTSQSTIKKTPSPTNTSIPLTSTPEFDVGSTMVGKDGMTLLYVPAGQFTMGRDAEDALAECQKYTPDCQSYWFVDEEPLHVVDLDAFWIDQTEITNKQYAMCVAAESCKLPSDTKSPMRAMYYSDPQYENYPVIYVDWYMAIAYCEWAGRRLPTEAEWEKAARGTNRLSYPWGNDLPNDNIVNYNSPIRDTTQVGIYPDGQSPYGAMDMAGNVWEWVSSLYRPYPYNETDGREDLTINGDRVLRGGAWYLLKGSVRPLFHAPYNLPNTLVRTDLRNWSASKYENISEHGRPPFGFGTVGFRCAMDATP